MFAHETIVVEYQPPEVGAAGRRLRPAEVGLLLDERADTLDVAATIIDLAVRKYLRISELPRRWIFGKRDYELARLKPAAEQQLLHYEETLLESLFKKEETVRLSALKGEFHTQLESVKAHLYDEAIKTNRFFARDPIVVRRRYQVAGLAALGAGAIWALGQLFHAGLAGVPVALGV